MSTMKAAHTPGHSPDEGRYYGQLYPKDAAERDRLREINAELLAALKYFIAETDDNDADYEPRTSPHAVARAAISKATGQGGAA